MNQNAPKNPVDIQGLALLEVANQLCSEIDPRIKVQAVRWNERGSIDGCWLEGNLPILASSITMDIVLSKRLKDELTPLEWKPIMASSIIDR